MALTKLLMWQSHLYSARAYENDSANYPETKERSQHRALRCWEALTNAGLVWC